MRQIFILITAFVSSLVLLTSSTLQAQETLDQILVIVGEHVILESEVQELLQQYIMEMKLDPIKDETAIEQQRQAILSNMIDEKVLLAKAAQDSIVVDAQKVDREVQKTIDSFLQQIGSQKRMEAYFGMTMGQVRREVKKNTEERMIINQVTQQHLMDVQVNRQDVEDFVAAYGDSLEMIPDMVNVGQIFFAIGVSPTGEQQTRELAWALYDSLTAGTDFAELARRWSDDPGTRDRGGLLGETSRGTLVKGYERVAYDMKPGEISEPVKTEFGYHIIRLEERQGERITTSHILLKLNPTDADVERTRALADSVANSIREGANFEDLASCFNSNQLLREAKGNLGPLPVSQLSEPIQKTLVNMLPGDVSPSVRTTVDEKDGFLVVVLNERHPKHTPNLSQDWEYLENMALQKAKAESMKKWLTELKQDVFIETFDN